MNTDCAGLEILMEGGVVNQDTHFLGADLASTVSKNEEHGIDDIRFATAIRANNGGETL